MEVMSLTAPSSPRLFSGIFLSAPTSPRRINDFYTDFDDDDNDDFAFDVCEKFETTSVFAEELFDGGKIKPLKPPPLYLDNRQLQDSSPRSPRSPKEIFRKAFSPRKKQVETDPFEIAMDKARRGVGEERGRDRRQNSTRRSARSLSPLRVSAYPWEEQENQQREEVQEQRKGSLSSIPSSSTCISCKSSSSSSSSKRWRLRDFLLFRSASEGRARHKTFSGLFKKQEDTKNSKASSSISPHEFHYRAKKAETKDLKKKTFLPYMQIGRFAF